MAVLFAVHFYVLVPPLIIGNIVDFFTAYVPGSSLHYFYLNVAILGSSFVIISFIRLTTKNALGNLSSEVMYRIKVRGFEKLLDFSLSWHLEESSGAKAQRIKNGVDSYKTLNAKLTNEIMRSVTAIIGVIAVFIFLRPLYVIFFLLYVIGFWTLLLLLYKRIQKENDAYFTSLEQAGGSYVEGLNNILTIKTLGAGSDFGTHIAKNENRTKQHELVIRKLYNNLWKTFQAFNGICYTIFLFLVGNDVITGHITAGSLVIFYGYLQSLIGSASDMVDTYETTLNAKTGIGRMMGIFWTKPAISSGKAILGNTWEQISLQSANFNYQSSTQLNTRGAVKNLNLQIPHFAKIGIVGKTGSGKSTLAKIFAGLYPLASGSYTIGDTSFYDLAHEEQTKHITLVLQETEIFNLTLRENITLMRHIDEEILVQALAIAQLEDVALKLPLGLDTIVGEKGYHLSGGERQRIGIARAICKNAQIIILDEATSSLDGKTELLIQDALKTKLQDKTIISIAHRVSTLEHTDKIYVFDGGSIVEEGTYASLSKNTSSTFYSLYKQGSHPS